MNNYRHTFISKATALLFMSLMLYINAVKLFHSHHDATVPLLSSKVNHLPLHSDSPLRQVEQDNRCPICDFNLMKNADITDSSIPLFIPVSGAALFASLLPESLHHFTIPCAGRDPPSVLS